ncbi:hypothetical protein KFE25_004827 [Diacronema lutheri]|uniref:Uncharacterized protein n=1 Tax=Diacronema lutheri TaxID=2081491 RepID=A0A8J5X837_DIALT|nr:hypothetical protein KFE25_004827 [Diacronema lutheri]
MKARNARPAILALAASSGGLRGRSLDEWASDAFTSYLRDPLRARAAPSTIAAAGKGAFAARDVEAGELVTLFPGIHYPAPPAAGAGDTLSHSYALGTALACKRDLAYALMLADGAIIDATPACLAECCILRRRMPRTNALGHLASQPPAGTPPNLLVLDLREFARAPPIEPGLLAHAPTVPSAYSHLTSSGEAVALDAADPRRAPRLVGLLAAAPLREGDELFFEIW